MGKAPAVFPTRSRGGGDRVHRQPVDGNSGDASAGSGDLAPSADGRRDAPDGDRPGRGDSRDLALDSPQPSGSEGSAAADRLVPLLRASGGRADGGGGG